MPTQYIIYMYLDTKYCYIITLFMLHDHSIIINKEIAEVASCKHIKNSRVRKGIWAKNV